MIKALSKTLFITLFLFNFTTIIPSLASLGDVVVDNTVPTVPFHFKIGAGDPDVKNRNGTKAAIVKFNIPCIDSFDPDTWLEVNNNPFLGVTHYLGAHRSLNLNPTTNIFLEYLQFAFLPQIKKGGKLSEEETIFTKTFNLFKPKSLTGYVGCHLFMPDKIADGAGGVVFLPGSKGARLSEFERARNYARNGIPCIIPDFVSTAKTNNAIGGNSTIGDQLKVSFFGKALSILMLHYTLQEWDAIDPKKIIWDCESIGSTQANLALMPPFIGKFEEAFIPPAHIVMNDLAPVLVTNDFTDSLFWKIPKTIFGGTQDKFTPLSQVKDYLKFAPEIQQTTLIEHNGVHDARSVDGDTPGQEGGTYDLKMATNYTGLCAHLNCSVKDLRDVIKDLDLTSGPDVIMGALEEPFGSLKLHLVLKDANLSPIQVSDIIRQLPKGGKFGPSSKEKATELRKQTIDTVLKYAL